MDTTAGYVYILINPSLDGLVKIGKTQNSPDERARELSSATGVPTPFYVAYSAYFQDCNTAEMFVHKRLAHHRSAQNKEFFRVTLQHAIEALREAESTLGTTSPELSANMAGKTNTYYTWELYDAASDERQKEILGEMTWKEQAKIFDGAPIEITLRYLPFLCAEAQVKVYRDYLPVKARDAAKVLLSPEAKARLKPRGRKQCLA